MSNDFLGLDLSLTSTGVFLKKENNDNEFFEIKTKPDQFNNSILRCEYISNKILNFVDLKNPTFICIEDYYVGKQFGSVIPLIELGTLIRYLMIKNERHFYTIAPTQLKKFCTGKGTGDKDNILKGVYKKWNIDVNSNNIADACVLAYISEAIYKTLNKIPITLTEYENEVIKKILIERKMY